MNIENIALHITGHKINSGFYEETQQKRGKTTDLFVSLRSNPRYANNEIIELKPRSSTRIDLLNNRSAGCIGITYSDEALLLVRKAARGFDIDYSSAALNQAVDEIGVKYLYTHPEECEVLIGGAYRVVRVERIEHPATSGYLHLYEVIECCDSL